MPKIQKILVAMSGGVDSSVAAYLLQKAGYDCAGVTMQLYPNACKNGARRACCSWRDMDDAAAVAYLLGIPFEPVDFSALFKARVIDKFVAVYESGGTPNPCLDCNRYLKFDRLLQYALENGRDAIATGHYARIDYDAAAGRWLLRRAADPAKDQSYVLYMLTQFQLAHLRLPLGGLHKSEVRAAAAAQGFPNAAKRDSQDVCFVPDGDYAAFLERTTGRRCVPGDLVDAQGRVLGRHRGAVCYTPGQRKGLGLALGAPVYVCGKDMAANTVTVGPESALYARAVLADEVNWVPFDAPPGPLRVTACTRYHGRETPARAVLQPDGLLRVEFDVPQRAPAPGQAVVLYDGDLLLGGGTIRTALTRRF